MPFAPSPASFNAKTLAEARLLDLCQSPASPAAVALVEDLAVRVVAAPAPGSQPRKTARRDASRAKLERAVGAIVGGLLDAWGREDARPTYHSRAKELFTGGPVGFDLWDSTTASLDTLGMLRSAGGKKFTREGFDFGSVVWRGWAPRYWPSPALLELAAGHGVGPETIRTDFRFVPPTRPPKITQVVVIRAVKIRDRGRRAEVAPIAELSDAIASKIEEDIQAANDMAARTVVGGPYPPRWHRIFHGAWNLHGRWYALGNVKTYQRNSQRERAAFTIDGAPTVELDVKASLLTVLRALSGEAVDAADPYSAIPLPREVTKRWVLDALGKGHAVNRWSAGAPVDCKAHKAATVRAAMVAAYPCLGDMEQIVPAALAEAIGSHRRALVWHYLAGFEAQAMTLALRELREAGILGLPVHDSLIVPAEAEGLARAAIVRGFERVCGVVPTIEKK